MMWSDILVKTHHYIASQQIWEKSSYGAVSLKPVGIPWVSRAVLWGASDSDGKKPEERDDSLPLPLPSLEEGSGQRVGVGEVWGVEWDQLVTSGRKNVPRLLSRPAPLAALHSVISAGAFCVQHPDPKPQSRGHRQAQSNTPEPPATTALLTIISLFCTSSLSNILDHKMVSINETCFFPLPPLSTNMLIAARS